eukprot:TRINITY_DN18426_c0_g1_i1.p4 TRINITY_DN18426_c0_g1~~TRINITY_DN18426_c0_g1_i1.p4  ORF type:complete len:137 (-),score=27.04 TRINITY_DN18426_c0_g1_i1:410-820(-)
MWRIPWPKKLIHLPKVQAEKKELSLFPTQELVSYLNERVVALETAAANKKELKEIDTVPLVTEEVEKPKRLSASPLRKNIFVVKKAHLGIIKGNKEDLKLKAAKRQMKLEGKVLYVLCRYSKRRKQYVITKHHSRE